ncbi:PDZ domain-containing protein [Gallaecimonas sp. GXIMD4217]|uniref:PDZ domain-containing protein n=1 Tax=Gallaecimonas sp. GXIMD4217 TaxID=3131927 RepID=UPI00311B1BA2
MKTMIATLVLGLAMGAYAADTDPEIREKVRAAVAAAQQGENLPPLTMEEPARRYYDWGAVLNKTLTVVAVSPGSDAQLMGVKKGDRLVAFNGSAVAGEPLKAVLARFETLEQQQPFSVTLAREGKEIQATTKANVKVTPAWRLEIGEVAAKSAPAVEGCGRVSVFFTPPEARDLYPAFVNAIDGEGVLRSRHSFKLAAGTHSIDLHELITDRRLKRRGGGLQEAKTIEIDVKPNTTYYLAAEFIPEQRYKTFKDGFWKPVVWKTSEVSCKE